MPSMEERLAELERALRLQNRGRAVLRALFTTAMQDVYDHIDQRFDDLDKRFDAQDRKIDAMRSEFTGQLDAMRADINALIEAVGKLIRPQS